jgi:DNA replication protein DnaC
MIQLVSRTDGDDSDLVNIADHTWMEPHMVTRRERRTSKAFEERARRLRHIAEVIPVSHTAAMFRNFDTNTDARRHARDYLSSMTPQHAPPVVVLGGHAGVGKTHLTAATVRRWIMRYGAWIEWANEAAMAERWRSAYAAGDHAEAAKITKDASEADLLVLDDIGKARATESWSAEVYAIINDRLEANRWTLVTTNLSYEQIIATYPDRFGAALADRLGSGKVLVVDGESHRCGWQSAA